MHACILQKQLNWQILLLTDTTGMIQCSTVVYAMLYPLDRSLYTFSTEAGKKLEQREAHFLVLRNSYHHLITGHFAVRNFGTRTFVPIFCP